MKSIIIIPARYASTRLPGKPLKDVAGKTLIQRVWEGAGSSEIASRTLIATDDERISRECERFGAECILTSDKARSGSDRILEAYDSINENAEIVVNVQGDEPLMSGELIDKLLSEFIDSKADVGTLIKKIDSLEEFKDNSVVKAIVGENGIAKDFKREIEFDDESKANEDIRNGVYYKHIGVYAYRTAVLRRFVNLPPSPREQREKLEQLRLLEDGATFLCVGTDKELIGIDTPEDLDRARRIFEKR